MSIHAHSLAWRLPWLPGPRQVILVTGDKGKKYRGPEVQRGRRGVAAKEMRSQTLTVTSILFIPACVASGK